MVLNLEYLHQGYEDISEITDEVRTENLKRSFTGGVRINQGMYRTTKEDEEYRRASLARKLP